MDDDVTKIGLHMTAGNFGPEFKRFIGTTKRENEAMKLLKAINPGDLPVWYEEKLPIVLEWMDEHDKKSMAYAKE